MVFRSPSLSRRTRRLSCLFPTAFLLFLSNLFAIELCATAPQHPQHSGDDAPLAAVFTFLFTPFGGMFVLALEKADEEVQQKGYVVILLVAAFVAGAIKLCTSASRAERPFIQEVEEGRAGGSTDAPPGYAPIAADEQSTVPAK
ncbi:hypothetical protein JCM8547_005761 [Rhodosporidiobolus lusitaniae]